MKEAETVNYLKELDKKYPDFSPENIFWNYKCTDKTDIEYRNHLIKLMAHINKLKPYDSTTYAQNKEAI